jgi:hypothetical protein
MKIMVKSAPLPTTCILHTLRPVREVLAKLDPKPKPEPLPPRKPFVPSLVLQRRNKRRR